MAAVAACEALLPIAEAALSQGGAALPPDLSGRALLKIGDSAGILFTAAQGSGRCELWRGGHPAPVADATIFFDSLASFRKVLQDPNAFPSLLLRRKLRLQGDASFLQSFQRPGSSSETAMVKELAKELDQAIGRALEQDAPEPIHCAAVWVPNDASDVCMECGKEFGILRRRHHCRACGRLLCGICAPKVPLSSDAVDMTCLPLGQNRNGIRLCCACDANGALPLLSGATTAAPSRRASMASSRRPSYMPRPHTASDVSEAASAFGAATEAAAERLREVKEEIEALRAAESKRTERHIRAGVQRIWLATHLCLAGLAFMLFLWRVTVAAAWLGMLVAVWHFDERSMLARIVRVFWAAAVVTCGVLETRFKLRALGVTEGEEYDAEWNSTHEVLARFLFLQILKLKGFWIKLGQQLSVNVMLAAPYRTEFSKLQDKIPPMPVSDVLKTLQEEFGAEVVSQIDIDSSPPLGTASIAQVHQALWRPKGAAHREVVVKVQHRGVDRQFRQDLRSSRVLAWLLAFVDPVDDLTAIAQQGSMTEASQPATEGEPARLLLEAGADKDLADARGCTALWSASSHGLVKVVRLLLQAGADKDLTDAIGRTALNTASWRGHVEVVHFLLAAGADKDLTNNDGYTELMSAFCRGHVEVVHLLLVAGADADLTNNDGCTALMSASGEGHVELVRLLLDASADTDLADDHGCTALMLASCECHVEVVHLLLEAGADKDLADDEGCTALKSASSRGHDEDEVVRLLLEAGADKDLADDEGYTALRPASYEGHVEVARSAPTRIWQTTKAAHL
eukprot:s1067_g6.t1